MAKKKLAAKRSTGSKKASVKRAKLNKGRPRSEEPRSQASSKHPNGGERPCILSRDRLAMARDEGPTGFFHKGLAHGSEGALNDEHTWSEFITGLLELNNSGDPTLLASLPIEADNRKWVNPLSGWSVDTEMSDPCFHKIPAPPALDSSETAAEAIELYWMTLLRDLPFPLWQGDANVESAVAELSQQPLYINRDGDVNKPPSVKGNGYKTTPLDAGKLFRGGELFKHDVLREKAGPFVSQFLLQDVPYGTLRIDQKNVWARPYTDYMTGSDDWLAVQNGEPRNPMQNLIGDCSQEAPMRRHLTTMRDLATYVHFDQLFQAYFNAALILIGNSYPLGEGNPYGSHCPPIGGVGMSGAAVPGQMLSQNQEGFGTFGGAHILSLVAEAATRALKSVWRQKWTHLRLRPEAYAGIVAFRSEVLPESGSRVLDSLAYQRSALRYPTGLLPMAFPEGSPMHPAYGAGHATVAGACVTILKAFFRESEPVRELKVASVDGLRLETYEGTDAGQLKVGMELDKLASNISIGRNMAGVHWRSDYTQSILLGQRVAVDMLFRKCRDYIEKFCFHFTSFGGGKVRVENSGVYYTQPDDAEKQVLSSSAFGFPDRSDREFDRAIADALLTIV